MQCPCCYTDLDDADGSDLSCGCLGWVDGDCEGLAVDDAVERMLVAMCGG